MDIETIESLAALVGRSKSVTELEFSAGSGTLRICRPGSVVEPIAAIPVAVQSPAGEVAVGAGGDADLVCVNAGVVGVFRPRRQPLAEGDRVTKGEVLGAIETMRIPSDCVAPTDGVVVAVLVGDGTPVEYGQPIARLRKD